MVVTRSWWFAPGRVGGSYIGTIELGAIDVIDAEIVGRAGYSAMSG